MVRAAMAKKKKPSTPAAAVGRLPKWLKRNVPLGNANFFTDRLLDELNLETAFMTLTKGITS